MNEMNMKRFLLPQFSKYVTTYFEIRVMRLLKIIKLLQMYFVLT